MRLPSQGGRRWPGSHVGLGRRGRHITPPPWPLGKQMPWRWASGPVWHWFIEGLYSPLAAGRRLFRPLSAGPPRRASSSCRGRCELPLSTASCQLPASFPPQTRRFLCVYPAEDSSGCRASLVLGKQPSPPSVSPTSRSPLSSPAPWTLPIPVLPPTLLNLPDFPSFYPPGLCGR